MLRSRPCQTRLVPSNRWNLAVTVRLRSTRAAALLEAEFGAAARITSASVAGRPLDLADRPAAAVDRLRLRYAGLPPEGIDVTLTIASPAPVTVNVTDVPHGLPATLPGLTVRPRPTDVVPAMTMTLDPTSVHRAVRL
jgi:hypothetical protein